MALLTLHRKQRFKVAIPYWVFIDGQPVGMMRSSDVGLDLPEGSDIVFLTNVAYIQNFDKTPTAKSANADLVTGCIEQKTRHHSAESKPTFLRLLNILNPHSTRHRQSSFSGWKRNNDKYHNDESKLHNSTACHVPVSDGMQSSNQRRGKQ